MTPNRVNKTRLPEAEREGLNASLVGGKICRGQNKAEDVADSKKASQNQRAMKAEKGGGISGTRKTPKSSKSKASRG